MANITVQRRLFHRRVVRVAVITAVALLLEVIGVLTPLRGLARRGWEPLQSLNGGLVSSVLAPYRIGTQLFHAAQRIQDLEQRYAEAAVELNELQTVREKADTLSQLCEASVSASPRQRHILAPIISYGQPMIRWTPIGEEATNLGSILVSGVLVGRLQENQGEYTPIALLSSRQLTPLLAKTTGNVTGLIRGDGEHILLEEVPIQDTLEVGQLVETVGQPGVEPNLTIGKIKAIIRQEGEVTQAAEIEQPVSFYAVRWVEVRP